MRKSLDYSKELIERISKKLSSKGFSGKDFDKALKKELYEIHHNYFKTFNYGKALEMLKKSQEKGVHEKLIKKYDPNRFIVLDELYKNIFKITGYPKILIDLACGLNPLTLPWMNLPKNCKYFCYDLEKGLIDFLNEYFSIIGKDYKAFLCDALSNPPNIKSDVCFLFKATTCFEWQSPGSTNELLKKIDSKFIIISVMLRGEKNIQGIRNYIDSIIGDFIKNKKTHEILLKKEYVLIVEN